MPHDIPAIVFCFDINEGTKIPVYRLDFSIISTIYHDENPLKAIELVEKKGVNTAQCPLTEHSTLQNTSFS